MNTPVNRSGQRLRLAAGIVWLFGGIVLLLKGSQLLQLAMSLRPDDYWTWLAVPAGLLVGGIKTELIFEKACRRNLDRIAALQDGRIWQAYTPRFYLFLVLMIALGGTLSTLAYGNYGGLMAVTILDFSLATALLGSGRLFWTHRQQHRAEADNKER